MIDSDEKLAAKRKRNCEKSKRHYARNRERILAGRAEYIKKYRAAHPEKCREASRKYAAKHRAKMGEYTRGWRAKNPEATRLHAVLWRKANPAKCTAAKKRRYVVKLRSTPIWLTEEERIQIQKIYATAAERTRLSGIRFEVDHVLPLRGKRVSGLHVPTNLQIIPKSENARKGNRVLM